MDPQVRQFSPEEKHKVDQQHGSTGAGDVELAPRVTLERIPTYLQPPISLRQRLRHFTFAWYTVTMSTGGIALALGLTPHRFRGLNTIGLVVFLFDLVCFVIISACLLLRFALYKDTFRRTLTRPREALFVSTFFLSIAALLSNAEKYGSLFLSEDAQDGLAVFLRVTFWLYVVVTFLLSVIQYHLLFSVKEQRRLTVNSMTPAWILPIFPVMLAGTIAAFDSPTQEPAQALAIISTGLAAQGLGMLVSIFMYATYLSRLMVYGLPAQRPGMFIAVGPPSFTCAALVAIADDVPRIFASEVPVIQGMLRPDILASGVQLAALYCSFFLWGLSFWFFVSAVMAVAAGMPDRKFHLSWWSFVFPNVGFCISTIRVGEATGSDGLLWFSTVQTIVLVLAWFYIAWRCVWAVIHREIVWPGHDEDSD
ncbi:hypothetical protein M406DRAFT_339743 [Cryphonectria parasitica EP155]|uniref:Malic acid transport protein n=1 Tax=Cryphonectria parasitica (strain ATCC 38755 / EP155) TaxID=660469 RepID=A0A9P4Y428_CRYP1|nr:uncharacterized protein M406DRAFT_339743 [Cryphonectria parasitica EP155]KAF3766569.1 hypothetical protein M406DRAFT_339743 [Cryphonectria parasitica EP155]